MTQRRINLNALADSHATEIERMVDSIRGDGSQSVWTSELRATTRSGKLLTLPVVDDDSL